MSEINDFIRYCMRRNIKSLYAKNEDGEYVLLPFALSYEKRSGDEYSTHFYSPSKEETTFTSKSGKYAPDPRELLECHNAQKNLVGKWRGIDVTYEPDNRVIFHFNNTIEVVDFMRTLEAKWRAVKWDD